MDSDAEIKEAKPVDLTTLQIDSVKNSEENRIVTEEIDQESEILKQNNTVWLERKSFRVALMSTFTALTVVLGYMLVFLPNIELVFTMIFLAGFIMGTRDGGIIGLFSSFIFCFFNPLGASPLPLLALQMIYYTSIGLISGALGRFMETRLFFNPYEDLYVFPVMIIFALIGGSVTFIYDILSTVVLALSVFGTMDAFWPNYLIGLPFTVTHLVFNILASIFILPGLIQLCYRLLNIGPDENSKDQIKLAQ